MAQRKQNEVTFAVDKATKRLVVTHTMHFDINPRFEKRDAELMCEDIVEVVERAFTQNKLEKLCLLCEGAPIPESEAERKRKYDKYWFRPFASKFKYPKNAPSGYQLKDWCETPADQCGSRGPMTQSDGRDMWACCCGRTFAVTQQGQMPVVKVLPDGTTSDEIEIITVDQPAEPPVVQKFKKQKKN
jgi:hypothetical protein